MPQRGYVTPEQAFGIARKPLNAWFDFAAQGLEREGPAFSTELEDASIRNTQRELEQEKLRRQLASEQAASQFLQQAAGKSPQGLMRMIAESPEVLGSQDFGQIREYVNIAQQRQQQRQAQQPFSNQVLGPAILKNLDPLDQARLQRRVAATGESIVDAYEAMEQEKQTTAQRAALEKKRLELLAKRVDPRLVNEAAASENPLEAFAILEGRASTGSGGVKRLEEMSLNELLDVREKISGEFPSAEDEPRLKRINALIDAQVMGTPLPVDRKEPPPGGDKTPPPAGDAAAAQIVPIADIAQLPLSPFEEQQNRAKAEAGQAEARKMQSWTTAKDQPLVRSGAAEGIQPQRVFDFAKKALVGQPVAGATTQEKQLASMIAAYAARAAEGKDIVVGQDFGEGGVTPRTESPGMALLKKLGVDPFEEIEIEGVGMFGGNRKMRALDLMNLRLKEIGDSAKRETTTQQKTTELNQAAESAYGELMGGNAPQTGK